MSKGKSKGKCEGCGQSPRILRQIESGQWVCQTCLREIHGPKGSPRLASLEQIKSLRQQGFNVSDDLPREEAKRLEWVISLRSLGMDVPENTPLEKLYRLAEAHAESFREAVALPSPVEGADCWHGLVDVRGTEHPNQDGTSRVDIIGRCAIGEQIRLIPEPHNPYDRNAIMVCRISGEQIGYLPRQCAAEVTAERTLQHQYWAFVDSIRDGGIQVDLTNGKSTPIYRVKLLMVVAQAFVGQETAAKYIRDVQISRHGIIG